MRFTGRIAVCQTLTTTFSFNSLYEILSRSWDRRVQRRYGEAFNSLYEIQDVGRIHKE